MGDAMNPRSDDGSLPGRALRGALAGIGATLAMSGVMLAAGRFGLVGEQPPEKISSRLLNRLKSPFHSEKEEEALGTLTHFGFGMALGAAYGILRRVVPPMRWPGSAIIYALGVWLASYAGWVPALGIMPPPDRDRPGRQPTMVAAHLVYGLTLGLLTRQLSRRRPRSA